VKQGSAVTMGLDVGDKHSQVCVLDSVSGEVVEESRIRSTPGGIERYFATRSEALVALEVGTHSPWISRALVSAGHEVIVGTCQLVCVWGWVMARGGG